MSTELVSQSLSPQLVEFAKGLLSGLHAMFGKKFLTHWEGVAFDELVAVWAHGFVGYKPKELKHGFERCKGLEWPPTLSEFLALCRPKLDAERAWIEASAAVRARELGQMGKWSSPVIYWAVVEGEFAYDLKHRSFKECKARWSDELERVGRIAEETELPSIPDPAPALPAPGKSKTSKEEGQARAAVLAEQIQAVADKRMGRGDGKNWARRILDDPRRKSIASVKMARAALPDYVPKARQDEQEYSDE